MATVRKSPTADASPNQWPTVNPAGPHWSAIDETMAAYNQVDFIASLGSGLTEKFSCTTTAPADMDTVTSIDVEVRFVALTIVANPALIVALLDGTNGDAVIASKKWDVDTDSNWKNLVFSYDGLSLTSAQWEGLKVSLQTAPKDGTEEIPEEY